ncbi:MAG TPA: hypothetical protein VFN51_03835 [Candidatus Saccharimonadales bacterium]|nr:hypothetical protein [Candidatus Saccharimonadales bacterium]
MPTIEQQHPGRDRLETDWISAERADYNTCRSGGILGDPEGPSMLSLNSDPQVAAVWLTNYFAGRQTYQEHHIAAAIAAENPALSIAHARIAVELPLRGNLAAASIDSDNKVTANESSYTPEDLNDLIKQKRDMIAGSAFPAWSKAVSAAVASGDGHLLGVASTELGILYRKNGMAETALPWLVNATGYLKHAVISTQIAASIEESARTTAEVDGKALHLVMAGLGALTAIRQLQKIDESSLHSFRDVAYALEDYGAPTKDIALAYRVLSGHTGLFSKERAFYSEQVKLVKKSSNFDLSVFMKRSRNRTLRPSPSLS